MSRPALTALYELIRQLRVPAVAPMVRFEEVPGEFSQHGFGRIDVRDTTGAVERVRLFRARIPPAEAYPPRVRRL